MKIDNENEVGLDELDELELEGLAEIIRQRYYDAKADRSNTFFDGKSVDEWLDEAYKRYTANFNNADFQLIRIKTDVVHAKVKDMSVGSIDAPFVVKPTPIPELSKEQTQAIQLDLETKLAEKLVQEGIIIVDENGDIKPRFDAVMDGSRMLPDAAEWLRKQAKAQKKSHQYEAGRIAGEAAAAATTVMLDKMAEGEWKQANLDADFDDFLYGTGCIKEEIKQVKQLTWVGDKFKETTKNQIVWRHVPIHNCYPSPDSEDAQNGTYFIEIVKMRKQDLLACKSIEWFDDDAIEEAYDEASINPEWLSDNPEQGEGWHDDALVDVIIHQGTVSGDTLNEFFGAGEGDSNYTDPYSFVDIEAYVLADVVIGCRIMNYPYGRRTYYSSNYKSAGKSFWGIGLAMLLANREDKLNEYERDIHINLDRTISPPIFYNIGMFDDPSDVSSGLEGRGKVIPFSADPTLAGGVPNSPYYQVQFPSKTAELTSLFGRDYRLADDESGIPSLLSGNSDLRGGEATFRGMKLLAATSNIIIKSYFHNKDETRIQPAMQNLWYYLMLNEDNETIKADAKVVARGTAGLMQQEIANAERLEALPIISQLLSASTLDDEKKGNIIDYLLRETMAAGGLPASQLMTDPAVVQEQRDTVQSARPSVTDEGGAAAMNAAAGAGVGAVADIMGSPMPATPMPTIGDDQNQGGLI